MEHFILGMLQEQLGKYIVGFHKEMVNASLLNGKGEIADLSLNCAAINQELSNIVPFIELDSIHISKVAFQVTSWTNLRKAPIMVDIEHVTINISEPFHYLDPRKRRRIRQMTVAEMESHFHRLAEEAKKKNAPFNNPNKRGGYSLADRIADNLMMEIKSIFIQFQTWGTFKTRRPGPWTPPTIQILLRNLRYCSVDEFGQEGTPEENWAHNHKPQTRGQEKTLLILKKITMDYDFGIRTVDGKGFSLLTGGRGGGVQPPEMPSSTGTATKTPPSPNAGLSQPPTNQQARGEPPKAAERLVAELAMNTSGPTKSTPETASDTDAVLATATGKDANAVSTVPTEKDSALAPTIQRSEEIIKQSIPSSDSQEQGCSVEEATKTIKKIPMGSETFAKEEAHRNTAAATKDAKTDREEMEDNIQARFESAGTSDPAEEYSNRVSVHMATKRRVRDGALLALQVDNTLSNVGVVIPAEVVQHLVHLAVGVYSCFCKDRSFEDPLRSKNDLTNHNDARSGRINGNNDEKHKEGDKKDIDRKGSKNAPIDDETGIGISRLEVASLASGSIEVDDRSETLPEIQHMNVASATIGRLPIVGNTGISGDTLCIPDASSSDKTPTNEMADTIPQIEQAEDKSKSISKSITSFFARRPSAMTTPAKSASAKEETPETSSDKAVPPISTLKPGKDRAIVMLPYGLVIHEKISLSVSIESATCRGVAGHSNSTRGAPRNVGDPEGKGKKCSSSKLDDLDPHEYLTTHEDYFQLNAQGVVVELIWPKVDLKRGGYVQASISNVSIHERVDGRKRILVSGGTRFDPFDVKIPGQPEENKEVFPLFQDRAIREDPLDVHRDYPAQAIRFIATIGCKISVTSPLNPLSTSVMMTTSPSAVTENPRPTTEMIQPPEKKREKFPGASVGKEIAGTVMKVMNEVGIDNFNVVLDCLSWCRVLRFILNESGNGFDPRWLSGDWTTMLTTAMLVHPNFSLDLDKHLQPVKNNSLDENEFISSDLFSINAKLTNCELCIPAAIQHSVRSCEIIVAVHSLLLKVSSDLPRPLISANIGRTLRGADLNEEAEKIRFPNDIADFSTEETARKENLTETPHTKSTFRLEFELRGLSTQIVPIIPYYKATKPRQFCAPASMTLSFCFEGEPPDTEARSPIKMNLLSSLVIDQISVNCDLDLLAGALSTCLYHHQIAKETFECFTKAATPMMTDPLPVENTCSILNGQDRSGDVASSGTNKNCGIENSSGRLFNAHKQFHRSREAGGLRAAFLLQVSGFDFCLWRQNVSISNPLHRGDYSAEVVGRKKFFLPLLKVFALSARRVEVGLEVGYQGGNRHGVAKGGIAEVRCSLCNLNAAAAAAATTTTTSSSTDGLRDGVDDLTAMATREGDAAILRKEDISEANRATSLKICGIEGDLGATKNNSGDDSVARKNLKNLGNADLSHTKDEHDHMINLFSFGYSSSTDGIFLQTSHAILLRYEEYLSASCSRSFAVDIGNGGVVELRADCVETAILLVLEALTMPSWSGVLVNPTCRQRRFPEKSVGSLFLSLIPGSDARLSSWLESLSNTVALAFPSDLRLFLVRIRMGDLRAAIPALIDQVDPKAEKCELILQCFDLTTWFVSPEGDFHRELLSVFSNRGEPWSACILNESPGVQHKFCSRQSLSLTMPRDSSSQSAVAVTLVPDFEVKLEYMQANLSVSIGNTLSFRDVEMMQRCFHFLRCFTECCVSIYDRLTERMASVGDMEPANEKMDEFDDTCGDRASHPTSYVYADMVESLQAAKILLLRMAQGFHEKEYDRRLALREKDAILEQLQRQVFQKERERLAAIALASSPVAGWLRTGSTHQSGQRVVSTSTLGRLWAVLRIDMIILYSSPGKYNPVDFVSLRGATMHSLAGGGSKWDLKRAFGIAEKKGTTRFFVAETTDEFIRWTREIEKVAKFYKAAAEEKAAMDATLDVAKTELCTEYTEVGSAGLGAVDSVHSVQDADTLRLQIGKLAIGGHALNDKEEDSPGTNSTSSVGLLNGGVSEAKTVHTGDSNLRGSEVFGKFSLKPNLHESSTATNPRNRQEGARTRNTSRLQLRGKVAGMGQATSRWGSALLSATKQTGKAVAEKARRGTNSPSSKDASPSEAGRGTWACPKCTYRNSTREFEAEVLVCDMCASPAKIADVVDVEFKKKIEEPLDTTVFDEEEDEAGSSETPERKELPFADHIDSGNTPPILSAGTSNDPGRTFTSDSGSTQFERTQSVSASNEDTEEDETYSVTSNLAVEDRAEAIRPSSHARAAGRFNMGTAVGNSLRSQRSVSPEGEKKNWLSRLGSNMSSHQVDSGNFQVMQPSLKLKNIRVDTSTDFKLDESLPLAHPPLDKLDGQWYVQVKEMESCSSDVDIDGTPNEKETPKTSPSSLCFCIKTFDLVGNGKVDVPTREVVRSFLDILCFHTFLSECIADLAHHPFFHEESYQGTMDISEVSAGFFDARGMSPLDIVRLSGALLAGTIDSMDSVSVDTLSSYNVNAVTEFLNSSLRCPLPRAALLSLSDLLGVSMVSREVWVTPENVEPGTLQKLSPPRCFNDTILLPEQRTKTADSGVFDQLGPVEDDPENILALSDRCITELMSAERHGKLPTAGLVAVQTSRLLPSVVSFHETLPLNHATEHLQELTHSALTKVMAERDEVHAQLVSISVMHMHALEQERLKTVRVAAKVEDLASKLQQQRQKKGGPLFGGSENNRKAEQDEKKGEEKRENMRQNIDIEIVTLCRQLSCEVSSSRKASLEVIRLQENRDIERQLEDKERAVLKTELVRMKEMLAQEKQKVEESKNEAEKWRHFYESIAGTGKDLS